MRQVSLKDFDAARSIRGSIRVRVATTANITVSTALNSGDTLDGITLADGDLVLVKDQSSASGNGIYIVATSPYRHPDFAATERNATAAYDTHPGIIVTVSEGTTNADTVWLCASDKGGTLDTTAISFLAIGGNATQIITLSSVSAVPLWLVSTDDSASIGPYLLLERASPSAASGDGLAAIRWRGRNAIGEAIFSYADIYGYLADATDGAEGGWLVFRTMIAGTLADRMYLAQGLVVGSPTGGDKGAGTINATAVYDDNVLLTCYALEAATKGAVNTEKWDHAAGREHKPARAFAERIGDLEPETFAEKWKASGVLPGMPTPDEWADAGGFSTGNIIQRLWELAEVQAVHIAKLTERIAALEIARSNNA